MNYTLALYVSKTYYAREIFIKTAKGELISPRFLIDDVKGGM